MSGVNLYSYKYWCRKRKQSIANIYSDSHTYSSKQSRKWVTLWFPEIKTQYLSHHSSSPTYLTSPHLMPCPLSPVRLIALNKRSLKTHLKKWNQKGKKRNKCPLYRLLLCPGAYAKRNEVYFVDLFMMCQFHTLSFCDSQVVFLSFFPSLLRENLPFNVLLGSVVRRGEGKDIFSEVFLFYFLLLWQISINLLYKLGLLMIVLLFVAFLLLLRLRVFHISIVSARLPKDIFVSWNCVVVVSVSWRSHPFIHRNTILREVWGKYPNTTSANG